ncbi:MAG TPA: 30S ribosomal protein S20 [Atopostipes sp.]|nr:30S ribosomal protein S20 [Atopostipes sp.]
MATSAQAKKRVRQNDAIRSRQKGQATAFRTAVQKAENAVSDNAENSESLINDAVQAIDKAVSKGLIHPNKAARKKSRLMKKANN